MIIQLIDLLFQEGSAELVIALQNPNTIYRMGEEEICGDPVVHRALCNSISNWNRNIKKHGTVHPGFIEWQQKVTSAKYKFIMTQGIANKFSHEFGLTYELIRSFAAGLLITSANRLHPDGILQIYNNVKEAHKRLEELKPTISDRYALQIIKYLINYSLVCERAYDKVRNREKFNEEELVSIGDRGIPKPPACPHQQMMYDQQMMYGAAPQQMYPQQQPPQYPQVPSIGQPQMYQPQMPPAPGSGCHAAANLPQQQMYPPEYPGQQQQENVMSPKLSQPQQQQMYAQPPQQPMYGQAPPAPASANKPQPTPSYPQYPQQQQQQAPAQGSGSKPQTAYQQQMYQPQGASSYPGQPQQMYPQQGAGSKQYPQYQQYTPPPQGAKPQQTYPGQPQQQGYPQYQQTFPGYPQQYPGYPPQQGQNKNTPNQYPQ
ncbi:hypothetical protein GPJ56_003435 [Histomonas meleagridis]|uniref:uncharacterized protein n=1 Tax=Histomonas meleagridis TaxID=135588 RepID=UPI00355A1E4E|nr:hypothetical protein GPJ56_003435 [Histomonas meleagridis]KAH0799127.1 hypothetical protein GO595_007924 [Histomonas meleagridis]